MTNNNEILKQRLRYYRLQAHLTQAQLAERLNSSTSWIGRMETKGKLPSFKYLLNLCAVLRVPIKYLFSEDETFNDLRLLKKLDAYDKDELYKVFNLLEGYIKSSK